MAKNKNYVYTNEDALNMINQGYEDYLCARYLLRNNQFIRHAVIHASTAVEKYLKAISITSTGKVEAVHLDNLPKIKDLFTGTQFENLIDRLDKNFMEVLGKAYSYRYLDNIQEDIGTLGFYVNQFLGELDSTINTLENCFVYQTIKSHYRRDLNVRREELYGNNWRIASIPKNVFMQRKTAIYGLGYFKGTKTPVYISGEIPSNYIYTGKMFILKLDVAAPTVT